MLRLFEEKPVKIIYSFTLVNKPKIAKIREISILTTSLHKYFLENNTQQTLSSSSWSGHSPKRCALVDFILKEISTIVHLFGFGYFWRDRANIEFIPIILIINYGWTFQNKIWSILCKSWFILNISSIFFKYMLHNFKYNFEKFRCNQNFLNKRRSI